MLEKGGASPPAVWVAQGVWLSSRAPFSRFEPVRRPWFRIRITGSWRRGRPVARAASGTSGWRRGGPLARAAGGTGGQWHERPVARAASGAGSWRHGGPLAFRAYKGSERFSCIRRQLMASFCDFCCLEVHENRIAASNCTKSAGIIGSRSRYGRRGGQAVASPRLACRPMSCA